MIAVTCTMKSMDRYPADGGYVELWRDHEPFGQLRFRGERSDRPASHSAGSG